MANPPLNPINFRLPFAVEGKAEPEVVDNLRYNTSSIVDLNQAIIALKAQVVAAHATATTALTSVSSIGTVSSGVSSFNALAGNVTYFPNLGELNNQTGGTAYTTQSTDNGAKIVVADAAPVTITLNALVGLPWFTLIDNEGPSVATLTPSSGVINGPATIQPQGFGIIFFDGTNWFVGATAVHPVNTPAVLHEWLASYNAATGVFGLSAPAFTDISGIATVAQGGTGTATPALVAGTNVTITGSFPNQTINASTTGFSGTIVTAKLTVGGSNGSMTFLNGLLTSQVAAT